jgi:hypothetical protein
MINLHSKYGKLVGTGPNEISVPDAEAIRKIYGSVATHCSSPFEIAGPFKGALILGHPAKTSPSMTGCVYTGRKDPSWLLGNPDSFVPAFGAGCHSEVRYPNCRSLFSLVGFIVV